MEHPDGQGVEYSLPISTKVVVDVDGQVVLARNVHDEWEIPGGRMEMDESPAQTARREIAEEIGLTLGGLTLLDTWVYRIRPDRHKLIIMFGTVYTGAPRPVCSTEHLELRMFAYAQAPALRMYPRYQQAIARWRHHDLRAAQRRQGMPPADGRRRPR